MRRLTGPEPVSSSSLPASSLRSPLSLRLVQQAIASCTACPGLRPWRQFAPEAYGTARTRYLLVGEAPGFVSLRKRRRFTGPAGLLIRRALKHITHARFQDLEDLFYMTDVVKCHPGAAHNPDANRSPRQSERRMCHGHLLRELQALRPAAIVTFGKAAAEEVRAALQVMAEAGGSLKPEPSLLAFPHPSPRNQTTIRKRYPSTEAFERAIAAAFRKLIRRLENHREASFVKRISDERAKCRPRTTRSERRGTNQDA